MKNINNNAYGFNDRRLSIIVFSLFFSWLLSFLFEGQILYALAKYHNISANSFVYSTIIAHLIGLLLSGLFIRNLRNAKYFMLFTIAFCIISSGIFFFTPSFLWTVALLLSSFLIGCCVAAWGFFFKRCTPRNERIKTIADGLIFSNILMILLNITAIHLSPHLALSCSVLMLGMAFIFSLRLPSEESSENPLLTDKREYFDSLGGPFAFLCLFIVVIAINSGLMYHVQGPAFSHLEWLTSWYWAFPYIMALFIMRNLPRRTNRAYILYVAIAMIGFSFLAFLVLDRSWMSYLVINTLMLGACGVYDLFWWSILGEMLELNKNPAKIMGVGLTANVLGVLLGGLIGNSVTSSSTQSQNPSLIALGVVCISLVLLPPLHKKLTALLKNHVYLTTIYEMPEKEQIRLLHDFIVSEKLTVRENEITAHLLKGKTYRTIAAQLHVSENTIKTHVKNIYSKTSVQSRAELMNLLLDVNALSSGSEKIR